MNPLLKSLFPGIILIVAVSACNNDDNFGRNQPCFSGQGSLNTETFNLDNFKSVAFAVPADLQLTQGAPQSVMITGQSNVFDELIVRVVNSELQIELDRCVDNMTSLQIQVTMPDVESLSMAGVGTIVGQNPLEVDDLVLNMAGVGEVTLTGEADNFDINLAGVGDVHAFDLKVDNCQVDIAGQGDAEVRVNDMLTVSIAGSGTVFYKGDPTISSSISGSGMVVNAN